MLDYSKFDKIGDSESEDDVDLDAAGALAGLLPCGGEQPGGPCEPASPPETPRPSAGGGAGDAEGTAGVPLPSFERFLELAEGAEQQRREDPMELLSAATATFQSALAGGEPSAPGRLAQAVARGLEAEPRPVPFAREQAPELLRELLSVVGSGLASAGDCERALRLVEQKCKAKEVYTFALEALCSDELGWPAKARGLHTLRHALLGMDETKRPPFLGSVLPAILSKLVGPPTPTEQIAAKLDALREFTAAFVPKSDGQDAGETGNVVKSMISCFLFKTLQKLMPAVLAVEGIDVALAEAASEDGLGVQRPRAQGPGPLAARAAAPRAVHLRGGQDETAMLALCALARAAASTSPKPVHVLLDEMDLGDPTGDGGGDLELSPLSLAAFLALPELHGRWKELRSQGLPLGFSAARRANAVLRACFVLVSNSEAACDVVSLGDASAAAGPAKRPRWSHCGLALFANSGAPLLRAAAAQSPQAFASLSGPLCRWHPPRVFRALLEAVASTPDIEQEARGAIFRHIAEAMRVFAWPCRFDLYLDFIQGCRIDSAMGCVVALLKDDWWASVVALVGAQANLHEERARLVRALKATLSGDLQVVDGMDTLTAALNLARLVALAGPPAGPFLRAALRKGGSGVDLDEMLAGVSRQIDIELGLVGSGGGGSGLSSELARELEAAMGAPEGAGLNMEQMKRDRIAMVAHLVARVREILAAASD